MTAAEVRVRILHTSDLHGNLCGDETAEGGMLRLATVIRQARQELPEATLWIDTGDTAQGGIAAALSHGMTPLRVLKALSCDVWIPGNHDFDYGFPAFLAAAEFLRSQILCGNLRPRGPEGSAEEAAAYPAWRLFECGGARVAVIGTTASYLPRWFLGFDEAFSVESACAMLQRVLPEVLRAKPDAVILATHQGWLEKDPRGVNEVREIARRFPEIDLILGGHTHRAFPGRRIGTHTWYLQPAAHGEFVAQADLLMDTEAHEVREISSKLLRVTSDLPQDAAALSAVSEELRAAEHAAAREVVAPPLPKAISAGGRPGMNCAMSEVLCCALAEATGADVALHGLLTKRGLEKGGAITQGKLFDVIPYENSIVVCEVTQEELAQIVAEQWLLRKSYTFCGIWGAVVQLHKDGTAQVLGVGKSIAPVAADQRLRLALNSFTAAGGGRTPLLTEILSRPECRMQTTGISTREALAQYLRKHADDLPTPYRWLRE